MNYIWDKPGYLGQLDFLSILKLSIEYVQMVNLKKLAIFYVNAHNSSTFWATEVFYTIFEISDTVLKIYLGEK